MFQENMNYGTQIQVMGISPRCIQSQSSISIISVLFLILLTVRKLLILYFFQSESNSSAMEFDKLKEFLEVCVLHKYGTNFFQEPNQNGQSAGTRNAIYSPVPNHSYYISECWTIILGQYTWINGKIPSGNIS